jgi:hypothetical protein
MATSKLNIFSQNVATLAYIFSKKILGTGYFGPTMPKISPKKRNTP